MRPDKHCKYRKSFDKLLKHISADCVSDDEYISDMEDDTADSSDFSGEVRVEYLEESAEVSAEEDGEENVPVALKSATTGQYLCSGTGYDAKYNTTGYTWPNNTRQDMGHPSCIADDTAEDGAGPVAGYSGASALLPVDIRTVRNGNDADAFNGGHGEQIRGAVRQMEWLSISNKNGRRDDNERVVSVDSKMRRKRSGKRCGNYDG